MKEIELKLKGEINRLTNKTFKFDERVGEGWFSAVYFLKTREIIEEFRPKSVVTMQFFQKGKCSSLRNRRSHCIATNIR